jgi:hypothetical protein
MRTAAIANTASTDDIWGGLGGLGNAEEMGIAGRELEVLKQERGISKGLKKAMAREMKLEDQRNASLSTDEEEGSVESETTKIEEFMDGSVMMSDNGSDASLIRGGYKVDEILPWEQLPWRKVTDVVEASDAPLTTCEFCFFFACNY